MVEKFTYKDYRVQAAFDEPTMQLTGITWYNENNRIAGPGDLPAETVYYQNGTPRLEIWKKEGLMYRQNDLPTQVHYSEETGKPVCFEWYNWKGLMHRGDDKPAFVQFNENSGLISVEFMKNGGYDREENKPNTLEFNVAQTDNFETEKFDPEWLPDSLLDLFSN